MGEGGTDELPDLLLARNSAQFSKGSFSEGYWCFSRALCGALALWNFWRTAAKRLFIRFGAESHFLFQSTVLAELWSFGRCFGALEFFENRSKAFIYKAWSGISFPFQKHRFSGALELWGFLCAGSPYSKLPAVLVSQFTFQWP